MALNHKQHLSIVLCIGSLIFVSSQSVYGGESSKSKTVLSQDSLSTRVDRKSNKNRDFLENKKSKRKKTPWQAIIDEITERFKREKTLLITRSPQGSNVCAVAPGVLEAENKIFSNQPVFVWQGDIDEIVVQNYETGNSMWSKKVPKNSHHLKYTGPTLKPGEVYIWALMLNGRFQKRMVVEIMSIEEREFYLQKTITHLHGFNEHSSLSRADFFSENKLWSDTLIALEKDLMPSNERVMEQVVNDWSNQFCRGELG